MSTVVAFGEVMTRFRVPGYRRVVQAFPGCVEVSFAGAEANVAASLAVLGDHARFVTSLPQNDIADACVSYLGRMGIDTSGILRTAGGRLGTYYLEVGANQRASGVIYDRAHTAVAEQDPAAYDWKALLARGDWLHVTGITPALSEKAAEAVLNAVQHAQQQGASVSCDLNFRGKLWNWQRPTAPRALARETMGRILPFVDTVIANEQDADDVLGIKAGDTVAESGSVDTGRYPDVAREIVSQFPNVKRVAITLRESVSASHNRWGAMLFDAGTGDSTFSPLRDGAYSPYEITDIVDRLGAGDSFAAGLIYAMRDAQLRGDAQRELDFAVAASCLCHSIDGDFNLVSRAEIETLVAGNASGRVRR